MEELMILKEFLLEGKIPEALELVEELEERGIALIFCRSTASISVEILAAKFLLPYPY